MQYAGASSHASDGAEDVGAVKVYGLRVGPQLVGRGLGEVSSARVPEFGERRILGENKELGRKQNNKGTSGTSTCLNS